MPELRLALADYLDRVRGTCAHAEPVVDAQGVSLLAGHVAHRCLRLALVRR